MCLDTCNNTSILFDCNNRRGLSVCVIVSDLVADLDWGSICELVAKRCRTNPEGSTYTQRTLNRNPGHSSDDSPVTGKHEILSSVSSAKSFAGVVC